jgi:hypothetical protein
MAMATGTGCELALVDKPSGDLVDYIVSMDLDVWRRRDCYEDVLRWMRFDGNGRDGMPWQTLGASYLETRVLKFAAKFELQSTLNRMGFLSLLGHDFKKKIRSASAIIGVAVSKTDDAAVVAAGGLALRAWARLNASGFGVQPLSAGSMAIYFRAAGVLPPDTSAERVKRIERGRDLVTFELGFKSPAIPIWMFRTGRSTPLPTSARAPRFPVEKLLTVE